MRKCAEAVVFGDLADAFIRSVLQARFSYQIIDVTDTDKRKSRPAQKEDAPVPLGPDLSLKALMRPYQKTDQVS